MMSPEERNPLVAKDGQEVCNEEKVVDRWGLIKCERVKGHTGHHLIDNDDHGEIDWPQPGESEVDQLRSEVAALRKEMDDMKRASSSS